VSTEPIRVLIADDHPFFRDGLRVLLEATPDTKLVGEATDGDEVVTLAVESKPDVILMDLRMPGLGGIEATRKILSTSPDTGILVVTMVEEDDSVFAPCEPGPAATCSRARTKTKCCWRSGRWRVGKPSSDQE
jgi:DNA-binding NarL/FixJ family response regulator